MVLYLPEALGVSQVLVKKAFYVVIKSKDPGMAKQCGIIRKMLPFELLEPKFENL